MVAREDRQIYVYWPSIVTVCSILLVARNKYLSIYPLFHANSSRRICECVWSVIMPILFVLSYMLYSYAIWLSLYLYGQYYFLEAIASLGVNFCKFVTEWAKVFKLIFSLTYSLLPPPVCFDKMWN